jgi:hypothetical protein
VVITYSARGGPHAGSIARLVTAQPRRILVATVAFLALAIAVGVPATGKLSVDPDVDFIDLPSESHLAREELARPSGAVSARDHRPGLILAARAQSPSARSCERSSRASNPTRAPAGRARC